MMAARVLETGILLFLVFGRLTCAEPVRASFSRVCPLGSVADSIFDFRDSHCPVHGGDGALGFVGVSEGDEVALQKALDMVHKNTHAYVAVLFYASWCPFSRTCRPTFSILSSLYPAIPHFAIEESAVRPSILSKYGVHGFPTLFLLNSTMRVRYHGSRTLGSFIAFYGDVTGMKAEPLERASQDKMASPSHHAKHDNSEQESCPFTWARSPEKLLRQETYLALAVTFVVLRSLYVIMPALLECAQCAWRRHLRDMNLGCLWSLWEYPLSYLNRAIQLFGSLKEPCKRSNLQEGAMNARAWASKSLASVSIGDGSSSSRMVVPNK